MSESKEKPQAPHQEAAEKVPVEKVELVKDAPRDEHEEWVFTLQCETGQVVKVEKLDKRSGNRVELSEEEYAALAASLAPAAEQPAGYDLEGLYASDPELYELAYFHGLTDYEATLLAHYPELTYTPEQLAYYQGAADYAAIYGG
jgi:hypothetical protein